MADPGRGRRIHPRRPIEGADLFCYRPSPGRVPRPRESLDGEILDLSCGGARLRLDRSVAPGELLMVELRDRRSGESLRARGEVRWCDAVPGGERGRHLVGLQFREVYSPVGRLETFGFRPAGPSSTPARREKRAAPRFTVHEGMVTLLPRGPLSPAGLRRNLALEVLDLGRRGVRLRTVDRLPAGACYVFTLHFPRLAETFEAGVEVRWCRPDPRVPEAPYQAGLQFLDLSAERLRRIDRLEKWFRRPRPGAGS